MCECSCMNCSGCTGDLGPEPVIVDNGQADAAESMSVASVEVARIEADRDVAVAKIANRGMDDDMVSQLAAMQARIDVLEAARIPAEPEPVPVPVPMPEPEPEPVPAPAETEPKAERKAPQRRGFF